MFRSVLVLAVIALVAGCSFLESPASTSTTETTAVSETGEVATTAPPATTLPEDSPCLAGDRPFVNDGLVSAFGGTEGDATQISSIRWGSHPGCERVVVDLLTAEGAPARALDPVAVEYNAEAGVIRVNLPMTLNRSAVADSLFDGELVRHAFVVQTADGDLALDVHLAAGRAYAVRAYEVDSPMRIAIDVQEDPEAPPAIGARVTPAVVVVAPHTGRVDSSFTVEGYAKGSYEDVTVNIYATTSEEAAASQVVTLVGDDKLWREFNVTFSALPAAPLRIAVTPDQQDQNAAEVSVNATPLSELDPSDV